MNKQNEVSKSKKPKKSKRFDSDDKPDAYYEEIDRRAEERIRKEKHNKPSLDDYDNG